MKANNNLIDDVKKFLGIAPYNDWTNICYGDGIFYESMKKKYGEEEVKKEISELSKKYNARL